MKRAVIAAVCLGGLLGATASARGGDVPVTGGRGAEPDPAQRDRSTVNRRLEAMFARGDYESAHRLLEQALQSRPRDHLMRYNLACTLAMLGRTDEAETALTDAISFGFVDFAAMERDAHLASLRSTSTFRAILRGWGELLEERRAADLRVMQEFFEGSYTYEQDESLRLQFASALEAGSLEAARREIRRVAVWWDEHFGAASPGANPDRPEPWVSVVLPTPTDFFRLIRADGVGGTYDRTVKRLIAQDIGATLRHEFVHVLHWRQLVHLGQEHPLWIMEGIASLVEDVELGEEDRLVIVPSWRTNIVKRLEARNGLMKWDQFFRLDQRRFMTVRPRAMYAQARAVFMFMEARGVLPQWYREYVKGFDQDPTGLSALELVFGADATTVERQFREWVRTLPEVAEVGRPGEAGLGVAVGPGSGDGPVVESSGRAAAGQAGERLRRRDVVESVDGTPTRNLDDLYRVLGGYDVGDQVAVQVRRGTRRLEIQLQLVGPDRVPQQP